MYLPDLSRVIGVGVTNVRVCISVDILEVIARREGHMISREAVTIVCLITCLQCPINITGAGATNARGCISPAMRRRGIVPRELHTIIPEAGTIACCGSEGIP